jgi:hypothetical protein
MSCGLCGGQSGTGAGFLQVLPFPLPLIPPTVPHSPHPSSGTGTIGQVDSVSPRPRKTTCGDYATTVSSLTNRLGRCVTPRIKLARI